jgi:hypothetical protein
MDVHEDQWQQRFMRIGGEFRCCAEQLAADRALLVLSLGAGRVLIAFRYERGKVCLFGGIHEDLAELFSYFRQGEPAELEGSALSRAPEQVTIEQVGNSLRAFSERAGASEALMVLGSAAADASLAYGLQGGRLNFRGDDFETYDSVFALLDAQPLVEITAETMIGGV